MRSTTFDGSAFVFGCGYSGQAFAGTLNAADVVGLTSRTPAKLSELAGRGMPVFAFDGDSGLGAEDGALLAALARTTHLIVSIAPGEGGDPVLRWLSPVIRHAMPRLEWIGYLSTVGVYGDHGGAWVDETTPPQPLSKRSRERVAAEEGWADLAASCGVPLARLRLSGIYGPGRNAFVNLAKGQARRLVKPGQVFNRIHVADIAGALRFLASRRIGGVVNVTDDEPAPPQDVVLYAARLMGVEPPPETDFETADLSPMARSFYGENKKVGNRHLKSLGYEFFFPSFREGLEALKP